MAADTQYTLKTYLEALWSAYGIDMKPGKYAAPDGSSDDTFALYVVIPNRNYFQPYIHEDNMQIRVFAKSYVNLSKMMNDAVDALNKENAQFDLSNNTPHSIFTDFKSAGAILHEITCRSSGLDQNEFFEGTEYYLATLDIMYSYVIGA